MKNSLQKRSDANRIFLHGGGNDLQSIKDFISHFSKGLTRVVVLLEHNRLDNLSNIKSTWDGLLGSAHYTFIRPRRGRLSESQLSAIRESDGIFINGGDTRSIQRTYCRGRARTSIRYAFKKGARYGGSSAGALLPSAQAIIWGGRARRDGQQYSVASPLANQEYKDPFGILKLGTGLGLVENCILDVHATEWGRIPRLWEALQTLKVPTGIAIDEDTWISITNHGVIKRHGKGRVYALTLHRNAALLSTVTKSNSSFLKGAVYQ